MLRPDEQRPRRRDVDAGAGDDGVRSAAGWLNTEGAAGGRAEGDGGLPPRTARTATSAPRRSSSRTTAVSSAWPSICPFYKDILVMLRPSSKDNGTTQRRWVPWNGQLGLPPLCRRFWCMRSGWLAAGAP